jgi:hypothetical protein
VKFHDITINYSEDSLKIRIINGIAETVEAGKAFRNLAISGNESFKSTDIIRCQLGKRRQNSLLN